MNKNRDIADLISKISNRNLQKRRETGATTYVLVSVVALILIQLAEELPILLGNEKPYEIDKIILVTSSLFWSFHLCLTGFLSSVGFKQTLKLGRSELSKRYFFEQIIEYSTPLIIVIPCIYLLQIEDSWYIYFSLAQISLIYLSGIADMISRYKNRKIKILALNKEAVKQFGDDATIFFIYFYGLTIAVASIVYIQNTPISLSSEDITRAIKVGAYIYIVGTLLGGILNQTKKEANNKYLEELEVSMYLENLTDEEVKKLLQEKYIGFGIKHWIKNQHSQFFSFITRIDDEIEKDNQFYETTKTVKELKHQRDLKLKVEELKKSLEIIHKKLITKYEELRTNFEYVEIQEKIYLTNEEIKEVQIFIEKINNIKDIRDKKLINLYQKVIALEQQYK